MKLAPLVASFLAVGLAGFSPKVSAAEIDNPDLLQLLAKLAQLRKQVLEADPETLQISAHQRASALQTTALTTGSIQGASGLDSGARGLTPVDDWRRMFPRKDKR